MKPIQILLCAYLLLAASCTAVSRKTNYFPGLYRDPVSAMLGNYDSPKTRKLLEKEMLDCKKYIDKEDDKEVAYLYDSHDNCRGDKLMESLEGQLRREDYQKNNLLFVYVGEAHMNSARLALQDEFDMYYFAEMPFLEEKEFELSLNTLQFIRKAKTEQTKKPFAIAVVYGDTHNKDYDFSRHLPVEELKKAGITQLTVALEDLPPEFTGKSLDCVKKQWEYFSFEANNMYSYLKDAENKGIKIRIIGIKEQYN